MLPQVHYTRRQAVGMQSGLADVFRLEEKRSSEALRLLQKPRNRELLTASL